jgi:hypothetical protein
MEQEEDEEESGGSDRDASTGPESETKRKAKIAKMKLKLLHGGKSGGAPVNKLNGSARLVKDKGYFEKGSVRNTARDLDFFHCFEQYLEEAIKKMKT